jgi:hypothetical protein
MQRPKRACTERAKEKIREILEWEACTESSQMFKDAANKLQAELCGEKKQKDYAPSSTSESEDESEEAESGAETPRSDSNDDTEKKAAAFESEAVEILERTCSHSPN